MALRSARHPLILRFAVLATLAAPLACDSGDKPSDRPDLKAAPTKAEPAANDTPAAAPAGKVFFIEPKDGATVPTKFEVKMGVEGKTVTPAGATERDPAQGHHHILIDGEPLADMTIVPKDEKNLHYGDGATQTTLLLTPGEHSLTLQFADGAHRSYGPDWAATIKVNVVDEPAAAAEEG